ncbi:MAG: carbohydrate ABC transporter permease [Actinomycetota bacterium]|nr:carbohydrate ABC transporter permease [Actinomycetota bacterium]MDQ3424421.1 carbohydrate ABC transporter permease [Actinomycetota bacterium]
MTLVGVVFVYPLVWLVSASLKPRSQVFDNAIIPAVWAPENYVEVWQEMALLQWLTNSLVVGFAAAAAVTISSALVAFGFAYFRFPGRQVLFGLVLATMMLPAAVTLIPTYVIWNELGLATSQVPLWAGNLFGSAFYIFLLRQFFKGLPRDLFEAARIDGCGFFSLFWRIAVPLSKPALLIAFIFEFQASWTDLLKPLVYLRDPELFTLPRGLKAVLDQFGQGGERQWEIVLAANVVATLPMLLLFVVAGRYFVRGISLTGSKE